jgi:hypothetical protein
MQLKKKRSKAKKGGRHHALRAGRGVDSLAPSDPSLVAIPTTASASAEDIIIPSGDSSFIGSAMYNVGYLSRKVLDTGLWLGDTVMFLPYHVQNVPLVGTAVNVVLDVLVVLLQNASIILSFAAPILPTLLQVLTNVGSALPIPGVNTVFGAGSLVVTVGNQPLSYIIGNIARYLLFFIHVSRKEYALAYPIALEIIPGFAELMDTLNLYLRISHKYLGPMTDLLDRSEEGLRLLEGAVATVKDDPGSLLHPSRFIRNTGFSADNTQLQCWAKRVNEWMKAFSSVEVDPKTPLSMRAAQAANALECSI